MALKLKVTIPAESDLKTIHLRAIDFCGGHRIRCYDVVPGDNLLALPEEVTKEIWTANILDGGYCLDEIDKKDMVILDD